MGNMGKREKIILKGVTASIGKVKGRVKIVNFPEEINGLSDREIIVVSFLVPDFLAAMRRNPQILGIVSDKGGITCHAAIIAREFRIPYVAGTKSATKKLKDGMIVTIDGKNGTIQG